jgi:putative ubiquitin-RnfH superfamily antitoxin RatB of RatAB toxin-antitoxin module
MADDEEMIEVEVAYARPDVQVIIPVRVAAGASVSAAIEESGLLKQFPDIDLDGANKVGVFGKLTRLNAPLQAGDRVEIYRQLIADPKEARRAKAGQAKPKKGDANAAPEDAAGE